MNAKPTLERHETEYGIIEHHTTAGLTNSHKIAIIVTVCVFVIITIYIIVAHSKNMWPFDKYVRKNGPSGSHMITGETRELTDEEKKIRDNLI